MHALKKAVDNPPGIIACTAIGYFLFAIVAQKVIYNHATACALWPAAGVALFAVIMRGKWGLAGTMLGTGIECLVVFSDKLPTNEWKLYAVTAVTTFGNCLEVLLLALLVHRMFDRGTDIMENFGKQIGFIAASLLCSIPSALCGVLIGCLTGVFNWTRCLGDIALWTVGDTFGILTIVPLLLVTVTNRSKSSLEDAAEWTWGVYFVLTIVILAGIGFWGWPVSYAIGNELGTLPAATYLLLVVVVQGCFYLRQSWILLGVNLVSAIAVGATVRRLGPLSVTEQIWRDGSPTQVLNELPTAINLYSFLFTLGMVGLCVSTAAARRLRRAKAAELTMQAVNIAEDELLAVSPVGIGWSLFHSEQGEFVKVSDLLATEFGYRDAREMEKDINGAKSIYVHAEDRQILKSFLNANPDKPFDNFIEMKKKNGDHLYVHLFARKVKRNGQQMILGFAKDVTSGMRRRSYHQIVQAVTNALRLTNPTKFWISDCLAKANQALELKPKFKLAKELRIWLSLEPLNDRNSFGDFRLYQQVGSLNKTTRRVSASQIIEDELANSNSFCSVIWDDERIVGVFVVDTPHWLFTPGANEDRVSDGCSLEDDVSLTSLRETIGLMIAQAFWKELVEERNKLIFELAPVGMFYADPMGDVYKYNEKAKEINGIAEDAIDSWNWLESLTDGCRSRLGQEWNQYSTECYNDPKNSLPRNFREYHKDRGGGVRLLDVMVLPIVQEGKCVGFMGTLVDNTDHELEKAKGNYIRHVFTHDAGSSLLLMSGAIAELNPDYFPFTNHQRKLIGRIAQCTQELTSLMGINKSDCEFNPIKTLTAIVGAHDSLGKLCEVDGDADTLVCGRRDVFQRVSKNLVTNAIKNQVSGGKVHACAALKENCLLLTIENRTQFPIGEDKLRDHDEASDLELLVDLNYRESERGLMLCRIAAREASGTFKLERKLDLVIATLELPVTKPSPYSQWSENLEFSEVGPILEELENIVLHGNRSREQYDNLACLLSEKKQTIASRLIECRDDTDRLDLCKELLKEHNHE